MKYFECKPGILCHGAECCTSIDTQPELTFGDFLRLSELTKEPIQRIWRTKGNVSLKHMPEIELEGVYAVSLGLMHGPCPYLSKDLKCTVHKRRPITCAGFPILLEEREVEDDDPHLETFQRYQCLQDVIMKPRQIEIGEKLKGIQLEEFLLDLKYVWSGEVPAIKALTDKDYKALAYHAIDIQLKRDPKGRNVRSMWLKQHIMDMVDEIKKLDNSEIVEIDPVLFLHHLQPLMGNIKIQLREDMPITAGNFKKLVQEGFYDGVIFHRIIDGFMIQGGDPTGTGTGGPGYVIEDEFTSNNKNNRGTIAMANAGPNTGGSQFFINLIDNNFLDSKHPVFGSVIESMDVVDKIEKVQTGPGDKPVEDVKIIKASLI